MFSNGPIVNRNGAPFMDTAERQGFEAFQNSMNTGSVKIHIQKIILRETGTYNNQYSRTYFSDIRPDQLRNFTDSLQGNPSQSFRPERIAGTLSGLISISAAPQSNAPINIPNSWNNSRLVFVMYVAAIAETGGQENYVLQGYTDYFGVNTMTKSIDPNMLFFINNVMKLRDEIKRTVHGAQVQSAVVNNYHVLSNAANNFVPDAQTIRPADVFSINYTNGWTDYGAQNMYLSSNSLRGTPVTSKRTNNLPSSYASTILSNTLLATNNAVVNDKHENVMDQALNFSREETLTSNPFMRALQRHNTTGMASQSFSYKDIEKLDANVYDRIDFIQQGQQQKAQLHQTGMTADWNGGRIEDQFAATLGQAFPALMMDNLISVLSVSFTNKTPGGNFTYLPEKVQMFSSQDAAIPVDTMMRRLNFEVIADLTQNNVIPYELTVHCSIYGETSITMTIDSFDGGYQYTYVTPSFCDGLTAPIIAYDKAIASNISNNMVELAGYAIDHLPSSMPMASSFTASSIQYGPGV